MAKVDWDTNAYTPSSGSFDPIPKGRYSAVLTNLQMKATKDKQGRYLEVEHTLSAPPFKNRKIWARLNVHNKSEVAERIGREQYSALCQAAGRPNCDDFDLLRNRAVDVYVSINKEGNGNDVNGWSGVSDETKAPPSAARSPSPPPGKKPSPQQPPTKKKQFTDGDTADDDIPF